MSLSTRPSRALAVIVGLIATLDCVNAATRLWPASAECPTTLQACVDGAVNGDRIEISAGTPIAENITLINRSLTLTSIDTTLPQFASGRYIDVAGSSVGGNITVNVSRLKLLNGFLRMQYSGTGTAAFDVRGLDIERSVGGTPAFIEVGASQGAVVNANVRENRISGAPPGLNSGLIGLGAGGATLNAYVAYNVLSRNAPTTADGAGIFVDVHTVLSQPGSGYVRAFGNEIRGGFNRSAMYFSEGLFSPTPSTLTARAFSNAIICSGEFARGMGFVVTAGSIDAQAVNNTINGCYNGISALRWEGASAASRVNGYIWNNVIVANTGMAFNPELTADLQNDYNLINASGNTATLGTHTLIADARLVAPSAPRLRTDSPAINAADGVFLANALIDAGLPLTDADGLRRVKGAGADIGAYEAGDASLLHIVSGANTTGHITRIDSPASNGQTAAKLLATRIYGPAGPRSFEPFGVYYQPSRWTLYNEAITPISSGLRWGVFVPGSGAGLFTHNGNASNTTAWHTQIDNAASNGLADRITLVTHNWSAANTYNEHMLGVYYSGSGSAGRWNIANIDQAALPATSAFNVYAQPPSPNAFRIVATVGARRVELDHALINGVACATVHATRVVSASSPGPTGTFDLDYNASTGRWALYSPVDWTTGTAFNVLIDPAQIFDCRDRIFANGFD